MTFENTVTKVVYKPVLKTYIVQNTFLFSHPLDSILKLFACFIIVFDKDKFDKYRLYNLIYVSSAMHQYYIPTWIYIPLPILKLAFL